MSSKRAKPQPADSVVLAEVPAGLLEGLPSEDQKAILGIIGKSIRLAGYDKDGRAELEFTNADGVIRFIYVDPNLIRAAQ